MTSVNSKRLEEIECAHCGERSIKQSGHVNRSRKIGAPVYCGRTCSSLARRLGSRPQESSATYGRFIVRRGSRRAVRLYATWTTMRSRCSDRKRKSYLDYGARGIQVCAEWDSYDAFRAWAISNGYRKNLTIDRIDVNGNYEPSNCQWIPRANQSWNTRRSIFLTLDGVTKTLSQWAGELGIRSALLRQRRADGWTDEQVLTTPVGGAARNASWWKAQIGGSL